MLESLHIKSFRGIQDFVLDDLRPITLLVGENNSGKTSILEAIMLATAPGDITNWKQLLQARDAAWGVEVLGEMAKWLFPVLGRDALDKRGPIGIRSSSHKGDEELFLTFAQESEMVQVERRGRLPGEIHLEEELLTHVHLTVEWYGKELGTKSGAIEFKQAPSPVRLREHMRIDDTVRRIPATKCVLVKPHAHRFGRHPVYSLSAAIKAGRKDVVLSFLQIFDPDISEIDIVENRTDTTIFVQHRKLGPMPIHSFGDGLRKATVVAGMVFQAQGGVLLIDEAETALHVDHQRPFFEALFAICAELQVQLFISTHSLDAVDAVLQSCPNSNALAGFHLPDRNSGKPMKRMDGDFLKRVRLERGLDIR